MLMLVYPALFIAAAVGGRKVAEELKPTSKDELDRMQNEYASELTKLNPRIDAINQERQRNLAERKKQLNRYRRPQLRDPVGTLRPTFRNLVLAGGGGKGLVYPSVYAVLKAAGFMNDITSVAGSSAGALTAAAIACGASPLDVAAVVRNARYLGAAVFSTSVDGVPPAPQIYTEQGIDSGQEIYAMFRHLYLVSFRMMATENMGRLEAIRAEGKVTDHDVSLIREIVEGKDATLTFRKLDIMHKANPVVFKKLTITGSNAENYKAEFGKLEIRGLFDPIDFHAVRVTGQFNTLYFNAETYPDLEIALAARMSMSLPALFKAVRFTDISDKDRPRVRLVVDGGVTSNIPVEIFLPNAAMSRVAAKHLTDSETYLQMLRDYGDTLVVSPENKAEAASTDKMLTMALNTGKASSTEATLGVTDDVVTNDWEKVFNGGPENVFSVPHGTLSTESFLTSKAPEIQQAQLSALVGTIQFCERAVKRRVEELPPHRRELPEILRLRDGIIKSKAHRPKPTEPKPRRG